MNKNNYNIEEVFKSELEDFEMDLPDNLWSNMSNNIASGSAASKAGFLSSNVFSIVAIGSTLAIIGGAILFSNYNQNNANELTQPFQETIVKESTIDNSDKKELRTVDQIEKTIETLPIDPTIEKVKQEENNSSKHYIINDIKTKKEEVISPTNSTNISIANQPEKTTIETIPIVSAPTQQIEIIEVKSTEITASISASPIGGYAPLTVNFSHNNVKASTYWNFKDGSKSEQKEVTHTFEKQGIYEVELTLTNEIGESSTATKTISILSTSSITNIPNIFTPNNDNINDEFKVAYENIEEFNLYIYNKKGKLVFETNEIDKGWNGNTNYGEEAVQGDYIYLIKANGIDGKIFEEKGMFKLAR